MKQIKLLKGMVHPKIKVDINY